jgi:hypothetical protein
MGKRGRSERAGEKSMKKKGTPAHSHNPRGAKLDEHDSMENLRKENAKLRMLLGTATELLGRSKELLAKKRQSPRRSKKKGGNTG